MNKAELVSCQYTRLQRFRRRIGSMWCKPAEWMNEWMNDVIWKKTSCDKKTAESQFSPTHVSSK